ncbi:Fungal specific transcription factor domain-containing protein [Cladophialophora immunda]|nr:Fungal specific transcription factor domain-containing protein [Cladophialophora immunda]
MDRLECANDGERLRILKEHFDQDANRRQRDPIIPDGPLSDSPHSDLPSDEEMIANETSVDVDGRICFFGTTSLYHYKPDQSTAPRMHPLGELASTMFPGPQVATPTSQLLDSPSDFLNPVEQPDIKSFLNTHVSSEICNELLETYWCWPHNIHFVLCRKIFMRDLIAGGPYVTPFLVNAALAQGARYSDRADASELGNYFAEQAVNLMAAEIQKDSSIPTIQALLILSGHESIIGRASQAWLFSGMAFRMMRDMGMHIHERKLSLAGQFSQVELAMRRQIMWSCYTCDKALSLLLGRAPTIHDTVALPTPETMLDGEETEEEEWKPRFATTSMLEIGVSQKAKTNSRFAAYCRLCVIIDRILTTLYYRRKAYADPQQLQGFLESSVEKLEEFALSLPPDLFIREDCRLIACPPLHILILNLLYHATFILLCRPYRSQLPRAREMATSAAEMIDRLIMLHIRRFGFRIVTYLESYTMFVASTINVLDLKDGIDKDGARARLALNLEVLRSATGTPSSTRCVTSSPSIARCVEIIETLLRENEKPLGADRPQHDKGPSSPAGMQEADTGAMPGHQQPNGNPLAAMAQQPPSFESHVPHPLAFSIQDTCGRGEAPPFSDFEPTYFDNWPAFFDNEPPAFQSEQSFFDAVSALPAPLPGRSCSMDMRITRPSGHDVVE